MIVLESGLKILNCCVVEPKVVKTVSNNKVSTENVTFANESPLDFLHEVDNPTISNSNDKQAIRNKRFFTMYNNVRLNYIFQKK